MAPDNVRLWQFRGTADRCDECRAPMLDPVPPHWPVTFSGPMQGGTITPHLPDCRALAKVRDNTPSPVIVQTEPA